MAERKWTYRVIGSCDWWWHACLKVDSERQNPERRVGAMETQDWNRQHPDQLSRTANRYTVYEQVRT